METVPGTTACQKVAEATLEDALIGRFWTLARRRARPLTLRSDNGLVFTSRRLVVSVQRPDLQQKFSNRTRPSRMA